MVLFLVVRNQIDAYVELPTWRLNLNCSRRGPIAQSLFPEFFWIDQTAIQDYHTLLVLIFPFG
jgi:hypothetical protein